MSEAGDMSLMNHLLELRQKLIRIMIAVGLLTASLLFFADDIYSFVSAPIRAALPEGATMIATEITSPFFAPLKLTLWVAFFLAIPYVLHEIWKFIAPGLYSHEKKIVIPILVSSVLLFYAGIAFAYYVVFPIVLGFFTSVGPEGVQLAPDINSYLNIALKLFFAFGFAFEIPIATILLISSKIISVENLRKQRPYVFIICFVVGMLLTPPDVISQTLLAVPMWLLFELGVFLGARLPKKDNLHQNLKQEDPSKDQ